MVIFYFIIELKIYYFDSIAYKNMVNKHKLMVNGCFTQF
jgi:hypothetical protein